MTTIRYIGPHPEIQVWPNGYTQAPITIANGEPLPDDLPTEFVNSLLEQEDNWEKAPAAKTRKTTKRED